ncbi:MAG: patatin-like phospholipase family protein [Bacteroidia bacterium]|nr:patatin-like phospholipase family protein [Bacteroidia bacterium]
MISPEFLQSISYFQHIPLDRLQALTREENLIHLACGEKLIEQGQKGNFAFVVLDGRFVSTTQNSLGVKTTLGEISRGEIVGEIAALLEQPRSATVTALRESLVLQIDRTALLEILQMHQGAFLDFTQTLVKRGKSTFQFKGEIRSVLLFPITPGIDLEEFGHEFIKALAHYKKSTFISPRIFEEQSGISLKNNSPADGNAIRHKLAEIEPRQELTVYSCRGEWDVWAKTCAARVDCLVLVALGSHFQEQGIPEKQMWEELESINHPRVELAIIYDQPGTKPAHTRKWMQDRKVFRHHHMVKNNAADVQKLARFVTGNSIGLALSGGGFKSSMQGGILHAMLENGIPLDIMGGSSGGAFAGAVFSNRPPLDKIPDLVAAGMEKFSKVTKLTFPMVSLYSGEKITQGFMDFFGDLDLEDLWTNYFCISLSLITGDLIVHRQGPVWEAVRASSSVMGLFPPVMSHGDVLVDGGFINPCPTNVLHEMGAGKIIVVSAFGKAGLQEVGYFPPTVSGWNLLGKRLNPFNHEVISPKIGASIVQSMLFASTHLLAGIFDKSEIDLFIEPDMSKYSAQDQDAVKVMYEIGYNYATERVSEWKSALNLP